jgi:hypothetical protein
MANSCGGSGKVIWNRGYVALPEKVLREHAGIIRYIGPRKDVRDLLCLADVVVLPSYY